MSLFRENFHTFLLIGGMIGVVTSWVCDLYDARTHRLKAPKSLKNYVGLTINVGLVLLMFLAIAI